MAAHGNYLYAIGGLIHQPGNSDPTQQYMSVPYIDRYDIQANQWKTIAQLPNPRSSYMAGVVGGIVYIIGGWFGNPSAGPVGGWFLNTIDTFTLATEQVGTLPYAMPGPLRRAGASVSHPTSITIIGGITNTIDPNSMALSSVLNFIPDSLSPWYWSAPLPNATFAPGAGTNNSGDIYAFGGWQGPPPMNPNFVNKVYMLQSTSSAWQELFPIAEDRGFIDVVNLSNNNFGLLGGALDPAQSGQQSTAFNPYVHAIIDEPKVPIWHAPRS